MVALQVKAVAGLSQASLVGAVRLVESCFTLARGDGAAFGSRVHPRSKGVRLSLNLGNAPSALSPVWGLPGN